MRSPERIDPFLQQLGEIWKQAPDLRFGQLILNLTAGHINCADNIWDLEEVDFEYLMEKFREKHSL